LVVQVERKARDWPSGDQVGVEFPQPVVAVDGVRIWSFVGSAMLVRWIWVPWRGRMDQATVGALGEMAASEGVRALPSVSIREAMRGLGGGAEVCAVRGRIAEAERRRRPKVRRTCIISTA